MVPHVKRRINAPARSCLFAVVIALLLSLCLIPAGADGQLSIRANDTVRAGEEYVAVIHITGAHIYSAKFDVTYDPNYLNFSYYYCARDTWEKTDYGQKGSTLTFWYTDKNLNDPINDADLIVVVFNVVNGLTPGSTTSIRVNNSDLSDGDTDFAPTAEKTVRIAEPLSGNSNLKSVYAENVTFSPAFDPNVTSYAASVPFSVSEIRITGTPDHPNAKVSSPYASLAVGQNTVYLTVTAENGAQKTYTFVITREQDPDYVPSSDTRLRSIALSDGVLSPAFSPDVFEYVVYVPYETSSVTVTGTPLDAKAVSGGRTEAELEIGDNRVLLEPIAEDGSVGAYVLHIRRMDLYDPETEAETEPETVPETEPETEPETVPETDPGTEPVTIPQETEKETGPSVTVVPNETENTEQTRNTSGDDSFTLLLLILVSAAALFIGLALGILIGRAGKRR